MSTGFKRSDRIAANLRQILGELFLQKINDPRIRCIQITDVSVSADLQHAKVYYLLMDGAPEVEEVEFVLKKVTGYLRREVGKRIKTKFIPSLRFMLDESTLYGRKMDSLLSDLELPPKEEPEEEPEDTHDR